MDAVTFGSNQWQNVEDEPLRVCDFHERRRETGAESDVYQCLVAHAVTSPYIHGHQVHAAVM